MRITRSIGTLKGGSGCSRNMHLGVPVFDLENRNCYLETKKRLSFCGPFYGYTTAEWIDFRNSDFGWRTLHRGELGAHLVLVKDGAIDLLECTPT